MSPTDMFKEPCPDRILEDVGGAFVMGAVGGSAFHFIRGLRNSPNGYRLAGAATAARMNAARIGGSFAVWGSLFSTFDCGLVYARQKEDPWNSIAAGAATCGLLSMRQGFLAFGRSAFFGGAFLALIEGTGIMINSLPVNGPPPEDLLQFPEKDTAQSAPSFLGMPPPPPIVVQELPVTESGTTGWFSGFFGKENDQVPGGDRKPEIDYNLKKVRSSDYLKEHQNIFR